MGSEMCIRDRYFNIVIGHLGRPHATHTAPMRVLTGSVHAHILTKPIRAGFAVSRSELIEPSAATCVTRHLGRVLKAWNIRTRYKYQYTSKYHSVFFLFWKKICRARPQPTTLSTGRPTVSLRDMLQVTLLLCQARSTDGDGEGLPYVP